MNRRTLLAALGAAPLAVVPGVAGAVDQRVSVPDTQPKVGGCEVHVETDGEGNVTGFVLFDPHGWVDGGALT